MRTTFMFASAGFFAGIAVALVLAMEQSPAVMSPEELLILWPTSVLGIDVNGWADGNLWHMLEFLFLFLGNGVVYALVAGAFGAFVESMRGR